MTSRWRAFAARRRRALFTSAALALTVVVAVATFRPAEPDGLLLGLFVTAGLLLMGAGFTRIGRRREPAYYAAHPAARTTIGEDPPPPSTPDRRYASPAVPSLGKVLAWLLGALAGAVVTVWPPSWLSDARLQCGAIAVCCLLCAGADLHPRVSREKP